jgi:hypothetical protein
MKNLVLLFSITALSLALLSEYTQAQSHADISGEKLAVLLGGATLGAIAGGLAGGFFDFAYASSISSKEMPAFPCSVALAGSM